MPLEDKENKKTNHPFPKNDEGNAQDEFLDISREEETEGDTGEGGQSGQVEFKEFIGSDQYLRDDLHPNEKKRLLATHNDAQKVSVEKQKKQREGYKELKEGKKSLQTYRQEKGLTGTGVSVHPELGDKAQFSSVSKQVTALPTDSEMMTNEEEKKKNELQYQPQLDPKYTLENAPRLSSPTPTLTRK